MSKTMKISLLTDASKHNLALMKISAWHKAQGHEVMLNMPLFPADLSYMSQLFEWTKLPICVDCHGGPGSGGYLVSLPEEIEEQQPDYDLYELDYSLGYTYRHCPRKCSFCIVPRFEKDKAHYSIWGFHDSRFSKICLLNNNTFADPRWKETFEEIWDADLAVIDENGYDLRLLDDEKADALYRTKWATPLHFAWDRMEDERLIIRGLKLLEKYKMRTTSHGVYVLIGFDTTEEEDLYRCQVIDDHGLTPYPMPYVHNSYTRSFKRFINLHYYRKYKTIAEAWGDYR